VAALQHCHDQRFLAVEMLIEAHFGDLGGGQDPIDADAVHAMAVDQALGGIEQAVSDVSHGHHDIQIGLSVYGNRFPCPPRNDLLPRSNGVRFPGCCPSIAR
jgi:hypothetical protein